MRKFDIVHDQQGRHIVHEARTLREVRAKLMPGYTIVGEFVELVPGAERPIVFPLREESIDDESVPTLMTMLLHFHGRELRSWLDPEPRRKPDRG